MNYREYTAAGGVVLDDGGRVLLLERWIERDAGIVHEIRLPKGHVDPGETDEEAALREVCEESGYCKLEVVGDLGEDVTEWTNRREHVYRIEHYFLMRLTSAEKGEPEFHSEDEAKFRVLWVENLEEAEAQLTYGSEQGFAGRARAYLADQPAPTAGAA